MKQVQITKFCSSTNANQVRPTLELRNTPQNFVAASLYKSGLGYSAINKARSALSSFWIRKLT
ncbi:hypothetical protein KUTeg_006634 [Tegillarca granosa]|uniref:Uncharacterized protein n=1 Tax=Tegillarca granosa TaxID=220873 RepID=A0ABQ9FAV1_TEGGR|nr:hypothetical protein KUTeg_006634 [Tegillarca granosa]